MGGLSNGLAVGAVFLLIPATAAFAQAPDTWITIGLCKVLSITTGSFGAVVMAVAGLVAVISAAMGSYRMTMSVIAIGAGTWVIEPLINLFFGYVTCQGTASFTPILPVGGTN